MTFGNPRQEYAIRGCETVLGGCERSKEALHTSDNSFSTILYQLHRAESYACCTHVVNALIPEACYRAKGAVICLPIQSMTKANTYERLCWEAFLEKMYLKAVAE